MISKGFPVGSFQRGERLHAVMADIEVELVDADFLEAISQLEEYYISGSQRSTSVSDDKFHTTVGPLTNLSAILMWKPDREWFCS